MSTCNLNPSKALLIYDGYCYLCSNTVEWILRSDKRKKIQLIHLHKALEDNNIQKLLSIYPSHDQIMLYYRQKLYIKSDAILIVSNLLGGWFVLFKIMQILPKRYRNLVYDFIAKNRYRIFGKRRLCHKPSSKFTDRYL